MKTFLILLVLGVSNCATDTSYSKETPTDTNTANRVGLAQEKGDLTPPKDSSFAKADGIVRFVGSGEDLRASSYLITIYGADGRAWKVIDRNDDSLESLSGIEGDFYPRIFSNGHSHDFAIEMSCTGRSKDWLEVVVHEDRNPPDKKYVRAGDPLFKFLSWQEWVMDHFNLRFDEEENPILDAPGGKRKSVTLPEEVLIKPEEVNGDWLKIRWIRHEPDEPDVGWLRKNRPDDFGWIRWKKGADTLISEYIP